jgi:superfamily II RNA helicase
MRRRFGHARCGLQTGDTSLNTEADIVIMTTEILRNIMYRTAEISDESAASKKLTFKGTYMLLSPA